jgi:uncharacterized membrane protein
MPSSQNRLIGIDVSYTIAIMGCIAYAFFFIMGDKVYSSLSHSRFNVIVDCFPAMFFFLNGFTVSLTMRDRRISSRKLLSYLGKRGSILLLIGFAFIVIWPMNILIASGLMYFAAPFVAQWNNVLLRIFTLLTIVFGISLLYVDVPTHTAYSLPTLEGGEIYNALGFVLFNGYYSVLPWFSFFFAGLLYGRAEIRPRGILPPSSILAILMIVASYFINRFAKKIDTDITVLQRSDLFFLNIRLLFPAFIIYAIGVSLLALNTSIYLFRKVENKRFLRTVQTISSQKYSVIFWHTVIGTITLLATNVQFFSKKIALLIYVALAMTLTLYLTFFWRKHVSEQGPIEWLIKRTSGSSKK